MIAVTGAEGKVGGFVLKELVEHGYKVRAVTLQPWEGHNADNAVADINDYGQVERALQGCDAVIHLAGIPSPRQNEYEVICTNLGGAYNVMHACGRLGIRRVALASSDCTLGFTFSRHKPLPLYLPVDEQHPMLADDCYGLSKQLLETAAAAMARRYPEMFVASLRISLVIDPKEYGQTDSVFARSISEPEADPWNLWSYIDGRDAAAAFRLAVETGHLKGHEVFHICADHTRSPVGSKQLIGSYFPDVELRAEFVSCESLESNKKAKELLGFQPSYGWQQRHSGEI